MGLKVNSLRVSFKGVWTTLLILAVFESGITILYNQSLVLKPLNSH